MFLSTDMCVWRSDLLLAHRFNRKVLVLARAASGKSVVLTQLGVAVAGAPSDGEDSAEQRVLPLKIPLVALASIMRQTTSEGAAGGGVGLLRRYLSEHEKFTPPRVECLARSLSHGAMLLLLDGLDEATTQVESVLRWVDEMSAAYPRLRVVLSSRPVTGVDPSAMGARGFRILLVVQRRRLAGGEDTMKSHACDPRPPALACRLWLRRMISPRSYHLPLVPKRARLYTQYRVAAQAAPSTCALGFALQEAVRSGTASHACGILYAGSTCDT